MTPHYVLHAIAIGMIIALIADVFQLRKCLWRAKCDLAISNGERIVLERDVGRANLEIEHLRIAASKIWVPTMEELDDDDFDDDEEEWPSGEGPLGYDPVEPVLAKILEDTLRWGSHDHPEQPWHFYPDGFDKETACMKQPTDEQPSCRSKTPPPVGACQRCIAEYKASAKYKWTGR